MYRLRRNLNLIEIILGQPASCPDGDDWMPLKNPVDFSFNNQGDLILLEKSKPFLRVLRSSNNQLDNLNLAFNEMKMNFASISHYLDGSILLANLASKEIFKLKSISLTNDDEQSNGLNIHSADKNEIYVFNRVGQHRSTIDALTGRSSSSLTLSPYHVFSRRNDLQFYLRFSAECLRKTGVDQLSEWSKFSVEIRLRHAYQ